MPTLNLQNELTPANGTLTLSQKTLNACLAQLITRYNQSQPITLTDAVLDSSTDSTTARLSGRSSYLGVADAAVAAQFTLTADGQASAVLKYQLRDSMPPATAWEFSRSFPTLPIMWNYAAQLPDGNNFASIVAQQRPFVSALALFDTYYVLATHAQTDTDWNIPLSAGLNFVSRLRPEGTLGVLENTFGHLQPLTLYGAVYFPQPGESTQPLINLERPWDRPQAPGIHLQASLGQGLTLGKLSITELALRIYTPLTKEWQAANTTFRPLYGYTGKLAIPSAAITLDISADLLWNQSNAMVYAKCKGVSLNKISQLADAVGNIDLASQLPKELQSAINSLKQIELTDLVFPLCTTSGGVSLEYIQMTIGMPSLTWQVWQGGLQVRDLSCRFLIDDPLSAPTIRNVIVTGTLDIEGVAMLVQASVSDNFTLMVSLPNGATIPLTKLMTKYASGVPAPGDLDINTLWASFSQDGSYSFSAQLADQPHPWVIPVGRHDLTVSNVTMQLSKTSATALAGKFSGSTAIDNKFILNLDYTLPGDMQLRGTFLNLSLRKLITLMCNQAGAMPSSFDFEITSLIVLVKKRGTAYAFQAVADIPSVGILAFEARRFTDGKSGFAAGVSLSSNALSQLAGLKALSALEGFVTLQKLLIVVATYDDTAFTFPEMANFNQPALATKSVTLPSGAGGIKSGFNILAEWTLRDTNQNERIIKTFLGLGGTEQVIVQVGNNPASDTRLMLARRGKIQGNDFNYVFGVQLTNGSASLYLTGSLTVNIQKKPQTFNLTTVFVPSGAFLSASMQGGSAIDCGPFQISNLGLAIGINVSGVPSLGITATLNIQKFSSSVAMFFDSADPSKSLLAGAVSDLTLKDVVGTLLGSTLKSSSIDDVLETIAIKGTQSFTLPSTLAADLNNRNLAPIATAFAAKNISIPSTVDKVLLVVAKADQTWYLTDLTKMRYYQIKKQGNDIVASVEAQLYFAPQPTTIGSIAFPMGYYLNAAIEFLGFHAQATVLISQNQGFTVDAYADKLVLVKESVFCLGSADGKKGPQISIATMKQPNHTVQAFRQPHVYISGSLTILGVKKVVDVSASKDGMTIEIKEELVDLVDFDLKVLVKKSGFSLSGSVTAGVDKIDLGELGKLDLDTDIEATITTIASADTLAFGVDASFELLGEKIRIARFNLNTDTPALANVGKTLIGKAEHEAKEIFKDADRWANALKKGALSGVDDAEKVLTKTFGKSSKEAKKIAGDVNDELKKGVKTATKKTKKFFKKVF